VRHLQLGGARQGRGRGLVTENGREMKEMSGGLQNKGKGEPASPCARVCVLLLLGEELGVRAGGVQKKK